MSTPTSQSSKVTKNAVIVAKNNKDWCVSISKKKKLYYFNSKTRESLWEKPDELMFTNTDLENLMSLAAKNMSEATDDAKQMNRTDKTPTTYLDFYPSKDQNENSTTEPNLKDDSGRNSSTDFVNKSTLNKSTIIQRKRCMKNNVKKQLSLEQLQKNNLYIERKLDILRNRQMESRVLEQMNLVVEVENNKTLMDWEDGLQENIEEVQNGMFFEDNLNRRNGSELINDTTSHQFEMNPNQMFHPKLAIVIDTNILVSNLKFVQDMKDKPFDEFPAKFIVPYRVLEELDHLKKQKGTIKSKGARNAIGMINADFLCNHPRIVGQNVEHSKHLEARTSTAGDDSIIECCLQQRRAGLNVLLFTADKNMTSRALMNGIESVGVVELRKLFPDVPKGSQFVNSKPHTIVSPQSSFGRLHVEEVQNVPVNVSNDISKRARRISNYVTETSQNRTVCQTTESVKIPVKSRINKVKISKKVPEDAIILVSKLKRALQHFLTGVLKIDDYVENSCILNVCLCHLQRNWTKVTNLPLLEEDIKDILTLKRLLRPVEDISWTVTSVNELMNAAIAIAGRFRKGDIHSLAATSFTLSLRDCQIIEHRLKQEITRKDTITPQAENETELYIAAAAFNATFLTMQHYVFSLCESLHSTLNSKKTDPQSSSSSNEPVNKKLCDNRNGFNELERLNGNEVPSIFNRKKTDPHCLPSLNELSDYGSKVASWLDGVNPNEEPFKLNKTKPETENLPSPDEDYIDQLSVVYRKVSDMVKGLEGVLNENLRALTLTHPSIQLLYNTIMAMLPESVPLTSPTKNSETVYLLADLTPKCILEYCSQEHNRGSLVSAKDSFYENLFKISATYDDYFFRNYKQE